MTENTLQVGDPVRERYVPAGCQPWHGKVTHVAPDGWVCVLLNSGLRGFSRPPYEVERDD